MLTDPNQTPRGETTDDSGKASPAGNASGGHVATRREETPLLERIALFITNAVGSIGFFIAMLVWTAGWLTWNAAAPKALRFDPYPAFVLWLFLSNVIQLFLLPLIMMGQNIQSRAADKRAEADLAVNRQAEEEVRMIREELAEIKRLVTQAVR
jgi:uncharacterized membrane protein